MPQWHFQRSPINYIIVLTAAVFPLSLISFSVQKEFLWISLLLDNPISWVSLLQGSLGFPPIQSGMFIFSYFLETELQLQHIAIIWMDLVFPQDMSIFLV